MLKNSLSQYLRYVAAGETVLVCDRDRVVAELSPPGLGRALKLEDARLAEEVRLGNLKPPANPGAALLAAEPVASFETVMKDLDEDRRG